MTGRIHFQPPRRLRARAEKLLTTSRRGLAQMPFDDVQKVLHELQVHQIELEMQNDELRRTQLELEAARERLLLPYEAAPIGFLSVDPGGLIREANLAAARLLNLDPVKLTGQKLTHFIAPESQDAFYLSRRELDATGENQACELHLLRKNGPQFIARLEIVREPAGAEAAARCLVMMSDITAQKQAERVLQEAHAELEQRVDERTKELTSANTALADFFNLAPIGLVWLSASGTILRTNQAQLDLLGGQMEKYLGSSFLESLVEPAEGRELLERLARKETVRNVRLTYRCQSGADRNVLVDAVSLWRDNEFKYSSVFSRDISDRLKLEREVLHVSEREQQRISRDLHDGLGQLLAGTVHLVDTLQKDLAAKSIPEARRLSRVMEVINEAIWQTRGLASGLHPVEAEPNGLMSALESLASRTQKLFHVTCRFICRRPVLVPDNSVATHLFRIAQEAVTNAVKHGKPGRIEISLKAPANRIILTVKDDGSGMPARRRKRAGMGLRIMHYRARMIGGSLVVQRGTHGGATVVCALNQAAKTPRHPRPKARKKS